MPNGEVAALAKAAERRYRSKAIRTSRANRASRAARADSWCSAGLNLRATAPQGRMTSGSTFLRDGERAGCRRVLRTPRVATRTLRRRGRSSLDSHGLSRRSLRALMYLDREDASLETGAARRRRGKPCAGPTLKERGVGCVLDAGGMTHHEDEHPTPQERFRYIACQRSCTPSPPNISAAQLPPWHT